MGWKPGDAERLVGGVGERVFLVHHLLSQVEEDHISLAKFGARVAEEEARLWPERASTTPYSGSSVSRWETGETEPSLFSMLAMTSMVNRALERAKDPNRIDPGWLAFGDACQAQAPSIPEPTLKELRLTRMSGRSGRPGRPALSAKTSRELVFPKRRGGGRKPGTSKD